MAWNYIRTAFAALGDKTAIPNDPQPDGSISQTDGYGINYQLNPASDPNALLIPRDKFNQLMSTTQNGVQQLQQDGFPFFITTSDNGGTPFPYKQWATVRFANGWAGASEFNYYSLEDANTTTPSNNAKWGLVQYAAPYFTGFSMPWFFSALPDSSWLWLNGLTVGNVGSNATGRSNADTRALFDKLWADYPTNLILFNSAGAPVARGLSAAADWAANRAIAVPDLRGRSFFGADNMGGAAAANRVTTGGSGIAGTAIGGVGGLEVVQLTGNQNAAHTHSGTVDSGGLHLHNATTDSAGDHSHQLECSPGDSGFGNALGTDGPFTGSPILSTKTAGLHAHALTTSNAGAHVHSFTSASSGLGEAHQNMPPSFIGGGWIMKL